MQGVLFFLHNPELLFLEHLSPAHLKRLPAEYLEEWLHLIVKIKQLVIPYLRLPVLRTASPICASLDRHVQSDNGLLNNELSLAILLVPRGLVGEGLHELVREYFDVGPAGAAYLVIAVVGVLSRSNGNLGLEVGGLGLEGVLVGDLDVLAGHDGRVGVASLDPSVPHQVVVRELAAIPYSVTSTAPPPTTPPRAPCISSWASRPWVLLRTYYPNSLSYNYIKTHGFQSSLCDFPLLATYCGVGCVFSY